MTIGQLLDRIEALTAAEPRQDANTRRKKATLVKFLRTVIASDPEWRDRVAAAAEMAHPIDTATALATAFRGKRLPLEDAPAPKKPTGFIL